MDRAQEETEQSNRERLDEWMMMMMMMITEEYKHICECECVRACVRVGGREQQG